MERDATEPGAKLEGPTLFGGCTELCFSTEWPISKFESDKKAGDLAMIVKKAPTSMGEAAKVRCCVSLVFLFCFSLVHVFVM